MNDNQRTKHEKQTSWATQQAEKIIVTGRGMEIERMDKKKLHWCLPSIFHHHHHSPSVFHCHQSYNFIVCHKIFFHRVIVNVMRWWCGRTNKRGWRKVEKSCCVLANGKLTKISENQEWWKDIKSSENVDEFLLHKIKSFRGCGMCRVPTPTAHFDDKILSIIILTRSKRTRNCKYLLCRSDTLRLMIRMNDRFPSQTNVQFPSQIHHLGVVLRLKDMQRSVKLWNSRWNSKFDIFVFSSPTISLLLDRLYWIWKK